MAVVNAATDRTTTKIKLDAAIQFAQIRAADMRQVDTGESGKAVLRRFSGVRELYDAASRALQNRELTEEEKMNAVVGAARAVKQKISRDPLFQLWIKEVIAKRPRTQIEPPAAACRARGSNGLAKVGDVISECMGMGRPDFGMSFDE